MQVLEEVLIVLGSELKLGCCAGLLLRLEHNAAANDSAERAST